MNPKKLRVGKLYQYNFEAIERMGPQEISVFIYLRSIETMFRDSYFVHEFIEGDRISVMSPLIVERFLEPVVKKKDKNRS